MIIKDNFRIKKIFIRLFNKGKGSKIIISTSKIKKMIEIEKNRNEKGCRVNEKGSKPHSKGVFFSLLKKFFFLIELARIIIKAVTNNEIKKKIIILF